jgi:hypothetical protein
MGSGNLPGDSPRADNTGHHLRNSASSFQIGEQNETNRSNNGDGLAEVVETEEVNAKIETQRMGVSSDITDLPLAGSDADLEPAGGLGVDSRPGAVELSVDYKNNTRRAEVRQPSATSKLDAAQSTRVGKENNPSIDSSLPQSTRVGIEGVGRKAKQRDDQPPHIPHCEWRASNKRTDGELSWRLLAVIEWVDPVSGEKQKKTQHVGYLPASVWGLMRKYDYETRKKLVEKEIGAKARASRESLEAYRNEAIRLSNAGISGTGG